MWFYYARRKVVDNMRSRLILTLLLAILFLFHKDTLASEKEKFVTVVNPVRISKYNKTPGESLETQYGVIKENNIPATWLFTFDSLENEEILSVASKMDENQEFGIFLEITRNFTEEVGIEYRDTGHWHHAGSVFLSGYLQEERKVLIDKVFEKYKEVFGEYPKSVGSWWTDSFSLSYMKETYGVEVNLGCADQFSTDNYQLWGQPWMMPYYPNKYHTGIPASNLDNKLDVVNIQWAARDPLNGYYSSLYSTQDYFIAPNRQTIEFFEKLISLYVEKFGQITIGLESDLSPAVYKDEYQKQIELVKKKKESGEVETLTMKDFASWYKNENTNLSPPKILESSDLLGSNEDVVWYQSSKFRLSYVKRGGKTIIRDLRIYPEDMIEPYYVTPNRDKKLTINIPSIFDEVSNEKNVWNLPADTKIEMEEDKIIITGKGLSIPKQLKSYQPYVEVKKEGNTIEISFGKEMNISKEGVVVKDYSSEAVHFFKQKKALFYLLTGKGWNHFKKVDYTVPQEEMYALYFLSTLPRGRVLVYDNECLQCSWHTKYKPPAFANSKKYVKEYSKHPIKKNSSVFNAETRKEAKKALGRTNVKYVYLVKHEDYVEKLPFSPGDLGVEKIFDNANAEVWRVK